MDTDKIATFPVLLNHDFNAVIGELRIKESALPLNGAEFELSAGWRVSHDGAELIEVSLVLSMAPKARRGL